MNTHRLLERDTTLKYWFQLCSYYLFYAPINCLVIW